MLGWKASPKSQICDPKTTNEDEANDAERPLESYRTMGQTREEERDTASNCAYPTRGIRFRATIYIQLIQYGGGKQIATYREYSATQG